MAGVRLRIDFFVPEDTNGTYVAAFDMKIADAAAAQIPTFKSSVNNLQALAEKINESGADEEATTDAKWHICRHDEDPLQPCGEWQDI